MRLSNARLTCRHFWPSTTFILAVISLILRSTSAQDTSSDGGSSSPQEEMKPIPLIITNNCSDTIWPAIHTDTGTGPDTHGFELHAGLQRSLSVGMDWKGRVWARTNCTFPNSAAPRQACATGDCAGALDCKVSTLAEFIIAGYGNLAYYDISLVDGFNVGMAIIVHSNGVGDMENSSRNGSNPSCVASAGDFHDLFNPYPGEQSFLGTDSQQPLPFALDVTRKQVSQWCPFDLLANPPQKPGDGIYPYPDDDIKRDIFQPCFSACAKYNDPKDCCTGDWNDANKCKAGYYSQQAKKVCPDAYSFDITAYDDQSSTFTVAAGAGFEIIMCPSGRSTKILDTLSQSSASSRKSRFQTITISSAATANGEGAAPPWIIFTAAALLVTACFFSSL